MNKTERSYKDKKNFLKGNVGDRDYLLCVEEWFASEIDLFCGVRLTV